MAFDGKKKNTQCVNHGQFHPIIHHGDEVVKMIRKMGALVHVLQSEVRTESNGQ